MLKGDRATPSLILFSMAEKSWMCKNILCGRECTVPLPDGAGLPCLLPDIVEWLQVFQQVLWMHQNSCWYVGVPALFSPRDRNTVLSSYASSCASFLPAVVHEANYCKHPARRAAWSTAFDDKVFIYDGDDDTSANNKFQSKLTLSYVCTPCLQLQSMVRWKFRIVASYYWSDTGNWVTTMQFWAVLAYSWSARLNSVTFAANDSCAFTVDKYGKNCMSLFIVDNHVEMY